MINTQEEAREWFTQALSATMKAKSAVIEALCGIEQPGDTETRLLNDTQPGLLPQEGRIDLVTMLDRYASKQGILTRADVMGAMLYIKRCPAVDLQMQMWNLFVCDPMDVMRNSKLPMME